jgi:uncharacterized membrane protein YeaQ/YmgE (transglycosylase-associated protein family)
MLLYILSLFVVGLIVGALGRLALPGPDPLTLLQTALVGIAGSLLAGLLVWAIYGRGGAGIVLSVLFSTGIVYAIRRSRGGTLTQPAPPRTRLRR